jgi:hypothetical protein
MHSTTDFYGLARLVVAAALLHSGFPSAQAAPAAPLVDVVKVEFGIFDDDGTDQLGFGATAEIPLSVGQPYGWLFQVKTATKTLAVREELLRPESDATPTEGSDTDLTPPVNRAALLGITEWRMPVQEGMVFGVRKVTPHDTPGRYRLKVYVERKLAATFDYVLSAVEIVAPAAAPQQKTSSGKPTVKPPNRSRRGSTPSSPSR